jgi:ParB family transcriptional regulator, chromosome partitioning protein
VNTPVLSIPLDQIEVGERLRAIDADYVSMIAASMAERGQDTPIIVTAHPAGEGRYRLVAGGHRVAAARAAGWTEIAGRVVEANELQAKLIEIDENLVRRELSALDRAVFLAQRKAVYEALHPETAHGKAKKNKALEKSASLHTFSFHKATAARLGLDASTIRRAVARAAMPPQVRAMIAGTPAADSGAELDKIVALGPSLQMDVATRLAGGDFRTVAAALLAINGAPRADSRAQADKQYAALLSAWRKAGKAARRRFLTFLENEGEVALPETEDA